ncbi:MAG: hypothetical protein II723_02065 [Oscillospiraceae bacterium]|nr:hypothetical protein [Oscillospiraceae bacterium]
MTALTALRYHSPWTVHKTVTVVLAVVVCIGLQLLLEKFVPQLEEKYRAAISYGAAVVLVLIALFCF